MSDLTIRLAGSIAKFAELLAGRFKGGSAVGQRLDEALERLSKVTRGLPTKHQETHLQGGSDAFPAPQAPPRININAASSAGTATNYMRANARPGIDLLIEPGEILVKNGASGAYEALPAGMDGQVLTAASAEDDGLKWTTPSGGGGGSSAEAIAAAWFLSGGA